MTERKAERRENPEPSWVKETMVADYKAIADKNGVTPSTSDIERIVLEDLRLSDAVDRETVERIPTKKPEPRREPSKKVTALAESLGWKVVKREIPKGPQPRRVGHADFLGRPPKTEKQRAIAARMAKLLAHESPFRISKETDFIGRALAHDFCELIVNLKEQRKEFAGKSPRDCERIFWSKAQDICDRSTGKHGQWWVPK